MKSVWREGGRERTAEVTVLGGGRYRVDVDGGVFEIAAEVLPDGTLRLIDDQGVTAARVTADSDRRFVRLGTMDFLLDRERSGRLRGAAGATAGLEAPMPGVVSRVQVSPGDAVTRGQPLLAVEAMKMEHWIRAPRDARIRAINARAGEMVRAGVALIELED